MDRKLKIQIHVVYWVIMHPLMFFAYSFSYYENVGGWYEFLFWAGAVTNRGTSMVMFYLFYSLLIPKLLLVKQRTFLFVGSTLISYLLFMCVFSLIWQKRAVFDGNYNFVDNISRDAKTLFSTVAYIPILALTAKLIEGWIGSELSYLKLKRLKTDSKIKFLKSQINPHFIFNTLNNIYSLSLKESRETSHALEKLQDTFLYLKKIEKDKVILLKDLRAYIESYVELSKLRLVFPDKVKLNFEIYDESKAVFPMLLIPFIENAFKHSYLVNDEDRILIDLKADDQGIELEVKNSISNHVVNKDNQKGIGLKNVQERLSLIFNKSDYLLKQTVKDNVYVSLIKFPYATV